MYTFTVVIITNTTQLSMALKALTAVLSGRRGCNRHCNHHTLAIVVYNKVHKM